MMKWLGLHLIPKTKRETAKTVLSKWGYIAQQAEIVNKKKSTTIDMKKIKQEIKEKAKADKIKKQIKLMEEKNKRLEEKLAKKEQIRLVNEEKTVTHNGKSMTMQHWLYQKFREQNCSRKTEKASFSFSKHSLQRASERIISKWVSMQRIRNDIDKNLYSARIAKWGALSVRWQIATYTIWKGTRPNSRVVITIYLSSVQEQRLLCTT